MTVLECKSSELNNYIGRNVAEIARERNTDPVDTFLDLAIEDHLQMQFNYELFNSDEERIPELITDPRTMIGLSDGGAHVVDTRAHLHALGRRLYPIPEAQSRDYRGNGGVGTRLSCTA